MKCKHLEKSQIEKCKHQDEDGVTEYQTSEVQCAQYLYMHNCELSAKLFQEVCFMGVHNDFWTRAWSCFKKQSHTCARPMWLQYACLLNFELHLSHVRNFLNGQAVHTRSRQFSNYCTHQRYKAIHRVHNTSWRTYSHWVCALPPAGISHACLKLFESFVSFPPVGAIVKPSAATRSMASSTSPVLHCWKSKERRSKGPCDVFDPWVRWERGQVGILEFVRRRRLEIWEPGNLGIWRSGDLEIQKFGIQKI